MSFRLNPSVRKNQRGMTLVELIVAFTILMLLTSMAVPLARNKVRRERERDLKIALREIHTAIDKYKDMADAGQLGQLKADADNYPETLDVLVEGVKVSGQGGGLGTPVSQTANNQSAFGQNNRPGSTSTTNSTTSSQPNSGSSSSNEEKKIRFLRRIPKDPFTGNTDWGMRSTRDDPKSTAWGGQNVFQVYSKTMEKARNGTPYSEW